MYQIITHCPNKKIPLVKKLRNRKKLQNVKYHDFEKIDLFYFRLIKD